MDRLKVGIAGFGVVGQKRKEIAERHPSLRVAAICDTRFNSDLKLLGHNESVPEGAYFDRGGTKYGLKNNEGIEFFRDFSVMTKSCDLDLLFVCLPNYLAASATILGLRNGLHVFCEKPPAVSLAEMVDVVNEEKKHPHLKLAYGFNHRHHLSVRDALEIIESKRLGNVINLRGVYGKSQLVTFNQPLWRTDREVAGGGVLLDQGIHMVDLMRLFAGNFKEVLSFVSSSFWKYDVEDNAYALMRTVDGVVAMLNSSATQWRHRFQLDVTLERGSLVLGGILSGSKSYGDETLTIVDANPGLDNGKPAEIIRRYTTDPSWEVEINSFVEAIMQGTDVLSGSSDDALETMRSVFRIYFADPDWRRKYSIDNPELVGSV